jgi:SAM-dependent methyltransferase
MVRPIQPRGGPLEIQGLGDRPVGTGSESPTCELVEKYDRIARGFSSRDYADPVCYARRRAAVIVAVGPRLHAGDQVLDLGCGDAFVARELTGLGLLYRGADLSPEMIDAARRLNPGLPFEVADSADYEPPRPVDATLCLRSFHYPHDRRAFFARVAGYTRGKFVFDLRRREHELGSILDDLAAAGFTAIALRPFFTPQLHRVPAVALQALYGFERTGPLARLASRRYGRLFCAAWRR